MARKVFISFLGTNNYVECYYSNDEHYPVRFIQEALIRETCKDWTVNDHIYIFCTKDAESKNWVDNGQEKIWEEVEKVGLETRLKSLNLKVPFEKVRIKEGFSVEEIWDIFDTVYDGTLKNGDQIYFDVTHAFRSIPLFSTVLFNYSRFMKDTEIMAIKYGAFEKLGTAFDVRKKDLRDRGVAPILDLINIVRLQEYTEIASNLVNFGKTKKLSTELQADNSDNRMLNFLCRSISELDEFIATNQLSKIREGNFIATFRTFVRPGSKQQPKPIKEILDKIKSETSAFGEKGSNINIETAIKWAKDHEMLVQAYSLAGEYIVLRISEHFATLNPFGKDNRARKSYREFISLVLGLPSEVIEKREFNGVLNGHDEIIMELLNEPFVISIRPEYEKIRKRRNSIIHGNGEFSYHDLDIDFYPIYNKCIEIINKFDSPCS